jgi:glycosyltransferase involved in cell wall biosynthesis
MQTRASDSSNLRASVIVPTYNKAPYLDLVLASFLLQDTHEFELVIVNDGSTDDTEAVVRRYLDRLEIRYIHQQNRGRSVARNAAIRAASGDVIIFSDDDRVVVSSFVRAHLARFTSSNDARVIQGWQRGILTRWVDSPAVVSATTIMRARDRELSERIGRGAELQLVTADDVEKNLAAVLERYQFSEPWWEEFCVPVINTFSEDLSDHRFSWSIATTANMSVTRTKLFEVGLLDENFQQWGLEDTDLCFRLTQSGSPIFIDRQALSYHQTHPTSPTKLHEWDNNLDYLLKKHEHIDLYLWAMRYRNQMGRATLQAFSMECEALRQDGRDLVVDELLRLYKKLYTVHRTLSTRPPPGIDF